MTGLNIVIYAINILYGRFKSTDTILKIISPIIVDNKQ